LRQAIVVVCLDPRVAGFSAVSFFLDLIAMRLWLFSRSGWLVLLSVVAGLPRNADAQQDGADYELEDAVLLIVEAVDVPASAAGQIVSLAVSNGEMAKAGDLLAQVDDLSARHLLRESQLEYEIVRAQSASRLDIEYAEKSQQVAETDLRRAQESNRAYAGVVSDREMDRLRLLVEQSGAELAKLQFEKKLMQMQLQLKQGAVEKNQLALDRHQIRAPINGQIVEIKKRVGEWVNVADAVFRLIRLDRLRVEGHLPVARARAGLLGSLATFQIAGENAPTFQGQVVYVSPEINPINETALVWIEFENQELRLRPGMKGRVSISGQLKSSPPVESAQR
jgi:macrolide-specific efflux system membrane fusion protein